MEEVGVLGAVHEDLGPVAVLGAPRAVPAGRLVPALALQAGALARRVAHGGALGWAGFPELGSGAGSRPGRRPGRGAVLKCSASNALPPARPPAPSAQPVPLQPLPLPAPPPPPVRAAAEQGDGACQARRRRPDALPLPVRPRAAPVVPERADAVAASGVLGEATGDRQGARLRVGLLAAPGNGVMPVWGVLELFLNIYDYFTILIIMYAYFVSIYV